MGAKLTAVWLICGLFLANYKFIAGYTEHPGRRFLPTKGALWPEPQNQTKSEEFLIILPGKFKINIVDKTCEILSNAVSRYSKDIKHLIHHRVYSLSKVLSKDHRQNAKRFYLNNPKHVGRLQSLDINLTQICENMPYLGMDETYTLEVHRNGYASLKSRSIWGILRGLESFYQSLFFMEDVIPYLQINITRIEDFPRFPHRGILLDTSRHYIPKATILQVLDGISQNKMNVFHWHIVDDQSFPYVSRKFPELSEKGAFSPTLVYTSEIVSEIMEYARMRGIRIIPEFDTPGHTRSWGEAYPELLSQCSNPSGELGPMDPSKNNTYKFMSDFLEEVRNVFYDKYVHLGGDEVGFECWSNNPSIFKCMKENRINTFEDLEGYYNARLHLIAEDLGLKAIVWQEVFHKTKLPASTIVQIWLGSMPSLLEKVTNAGNMAILSTCWYLDQLKDGGDWEKFYNCEPHNFSGSEKQKKLVLGGEACMWSEVVSSSNAIARIFPRASSAAEKLWSKYRVGVPDDRVRSRLEEHACRMKLRGLPAQPPSGPGYCF